jgi:hypothetical protein
MRGIRYVAPVAALTALAGWMAGCDLLPGDLTGSISTNQKPVVEFTNVPAPGDTFAYAPVIYWKGRDPDGFVEKYSYADIIDATALVEPQYYIDFIPKEAWVETEATSDTVYLLTVTGQVTEHVFYVKCVDDRGAESGIVYRTFYRSNQRPHVPQIKYYSEPDYTYGNDIPNPDSLNHVLNDTLYCLDEWTETWQGLGFSWKSSDPDDSELYAIPLQYRYYLEKVPHDTIWQWVALDWTRTQEVRFDGLETGHYVFTVWARDDGFETSVRPATATFDVYRPTFEQSILLLSTTAIDPSGRTLHWNLIPGTPIGDFYQSQLAGYSDLEFLQYEGGMKLWKAYLGRFKLVIWFSENQETTIDTLFKERDLINYVNIGGRLWVIGLMTHKNMITNNTLALARTVFAGPAAGVAIPQSGAEFAGAISGVTDLPDLGLDTNRTGEVWRRWFRNPSDTTKYRIDLYPLLPGVDIFTAETGVETAYYFSSYTDTASGDVTNELAEVRASVDTINYPPTSVDCIIVLQRNRVSDITRVENITRGVFGTPVSRTNNVTVGNKQRCIARVSYEYGEPWSLTDSVVVDYTYLPFSDFHMKPCAIRYERVEPAEGTGYQVLYRVAVFNFPFYYLDDSNQNVTRMFQSMLRWFFLPYAH